MSITDELRAWLDEYGCEYGSEKFIAGSFGSIGQDRLISIADRIDAEHEAMLADARKTVYQGYVELPKDADGVPIHVGDELAVYGYPNGGAYCKAIVGEWGILAGEQDCKY